MDADLPSNKVNMEQQDKASTPHPAYTGLEIKRDVYRAVYGGTDTIRAASTTYLPKYPGEGDDYKDRLAASTIDGLVAGGVDQLCGSVFEGEIDTTGVKLDKKLLENIDNKGNHFNIFARDAFEASFEGCSLILVDMPTGKAEDFEQQQKLGLRPYLNLYTAANVINWRYQVNPVSKQKELVLLVLKEVSAEPKGRFLTENVTRYRVFTFENGVIIWELWKEVKQAVNGLELILEDTGTVEKVTAIPAVFIGDVLDDPKLLVESRLEIKAYQKESSFDVIEYLSIPTFFTKGYEGEEQLKLGSSVHVKLPLEGDVGFAQIDSAGLDSLKATIRETKDYIKSRVNYLVDSAGPDKTATEVVVADKDKQARLVVWADELKDALETALMYMGQFVGLGEDGAGEIALRTKWVVAAEQAAENKQLEMERHKAEIGKMKTGAMNNENRIHSNNE